MAQLALIINGPAGVGKSTIARRIATCAPNGACIAGDDLKRFVVNRVEPPTVELGLTYVGAAALTDVFLTAGYDLVVTDFVFEHPRHIQRYTQALNIPVQTLALTLWAPLDVVERRHEQRARPGQDRDSATRSWHAIAAHLDDLGAIVDARGTIEQTLAATATHIDQHRSGHALHAGRLTRHTVLAERGSGHPAGVSLRSRPRRRARAAPAACAGASRFWCNQGLALVKQRLDERGGGGCRGALVVQGLCVAFCGDAIKDKLPPWRSQVVTGSYQAGLEALGRALQN